MPILNDVHARLSPTEVLEVVQPRSVEDVRQAILAAARRGVSISVGGGRHAMGAQPFGTGTVHLDMRGMNRTLGFDAARGIIDLEAGADWPTIIRAVHDAQNAHDSHDAHQAGESRDSRSGPRRSHASIRWGIRQKQTGADALTLGGAISANVHGRGLMMRPIIDDIEDLTIVTPTAEVVRCSRAEHPDLFRLVVGGYGLFGVIVRASLRLGPRLKLRRIVDIIDLDDAMNAVYRRVNDGCVYGDFQYAIDETDPSFLRRGVFACYQPAPVDSPDPAADADLPRTAWVELLKLAHTDKRRAFQLYAQHYLSTHGNLYWSDTMQLATYIPSYSEFVAEARGPSRPAAGESLMITELYVPPSRLMDFMAAARKTLRDNGTEDIYGTIRAIRRDEESFLPWARDDSACVIFNLRTVHDEAGIAATTRTARQLIDAAADLGGSFYLTYHRWATASQLLRCHPRLPEFIAAKHRYDPSERFSSDWWIWLKNTVGRG